MIDLHKTSHVVFFCIILPAISFAVGWLFSLLNFPFWVNTISPLGAYGLMYKLFDNYLWHYKVFSFFNIVCFPDLRGRWEGQIMSTYNNTKTHHTVLEIFQRFSKIIIRAYYEKSQAESVVANFTNINGTTYLFYIYDNEVNAKKVGAMANHKGTTKLKLLPKGKRLSGSYYNSRGHQGDIDVMFKQKECLGKFKE